MSNTVAPRKTVQHLGEIVRVARARQRLSQAQVAKLAGTSPVRLSEIESGTGDPRLSTVERITDVLGLSIAVTEPAA